MQKEKNTQEYNWKTSSYKKPRGNNEYRTYERKTESYRRNNRNQHRRNNEKSEQKIPEQSSKSPKQQNISSIQSVQPIYNGPNFSKLISSFKTVTQHSNNTVDSSEYNENTSFIIPRINDRYRKSVRNHISKPNQNVSYDTWEFTYFKHSLNLRDIFSKCVIDLQIPGVDIKSADFFNIFGNFIRECSSGEISPYIEKLNQKEEKIYLEYIIKRNKI